MKSPTDIVALYKSRERRDQGLNATRAEIRDVFNNNMDVPLPEMDRNERPMTPNLLRQGADQLSARVASTPPHPKWSPDKPGTRADEAARLRTQVNLGWWDMNGMGRKLRQRARHLIVYGTTPVIVRPNAMKGIPCWYVRDPMGSFVSMTGDDDFHPADAVFCFDRTWGWLQDYYPMQAAMVSRPRDTKPDDKFKLLEYVDAGEITLVALGRESNYGTSGTEHSVVLEQVENRAGVCPVASPGRITLDSPQGQFDGMVGMYWTQSMLMALEVIAAKKFVFPEFWLLGDGPQTPEILAQADGMTGQVGVTRNGRPYERAPAPGFQTNPTIDRLERAQRLTGGIPQELGGESATNIRTGRRGDAVLSAAIDFSIQESQEILAASLEVENRIAVAIAKAYFPTERSIYVSWKGAKGQVTYEPNALFTTDENHVSYSSSGADVNGLVISGGQRVGLETMSRRTFMEIDPMVEDPEAEHDRITTEALEHALRSAIEMQASQGAIPPSDLARISELVSTNRAELYEAVQKAHEEAQARQATPAEQPAEAQPGLGPAGQGAEQPSVDQNPNLQNLASLMSQLGRPGQVARGAA